MKNRLVQYPYATFVNLPHDFEDEFAARVRLYGTALSFLFAKEFALIGGRNPEDRESNRTMWYLRTTDALARLCHVRSSFDDWLLTVQNGISVNRHAIRWGCGVAILSRLVVEPNVAAVFPIIREHCSHMNVFLRGSDLDVCVYSTEPLVRGVIASLEYSIQKLSSGSMPLITPAMQTNEKSVAKRRFDHTVRMLQTASMGMLTPSLIPQFRRDLAEVALSNCGASDAHEFLVAALYGSAGDLIALCQSLQC